MGPKSLGLGLLLLNALLGVAGAGLIQRTIRHRRETLAPSIRDNFTLPDTDQPVVFNHVYNINVPAGSACSVDLESPGSSGLEPREEEAAPPELHATEHTLGQENQIVFTHRINVPRQACGCQGAGAIPDLKALLARLEMLEAEVSTLRDQCGAAEAGCCTAQVAGAVGTQPYCNGHGNFSSTACGCVCEPGWSGAHCDEAVCPLDCGDNGACEDGACLCDPGFAGPDCGRRTCPHDCHGNGFCGADGVCVCSVGYRGDDCSELACPGDCSGRGACLDGVCVCDGGYRGEDCGLAACPDDCGGRGRCVEGVCVCDPGYQGDNCSEPSCPAACRGRGHCVYGQCVCDPGFTGEDCGARTCPGGCHGHGECVDGRCVCFPEFSGEDCSALSCPHDCHRRGRCVAGRCVCDPRFAGEACERKACPNACLARGFCLDGKCVCNEGFSGTDCSVAVCPDDCGGRGRCLDGRCACDPGYEGPGCGERSCPAACLEGGRCVDGRCVCEEGFIGPDCSRVSPPKDLSVREVTPHSVDLSWTNEKLVNRYVVTYVPTAPGGLLQELSVPGDDAGAQVEGLEPGVEYLINVYALLSNKKSVPVSARVATSLPQPEGLRFKSVRESSVEVEWDPLEIPFDGWELYIRNTKEENGKIVNILPPSQNSFEQSGLGPGQEYEVSLRVLKNSTAGPQTTRTFNTKIEGPQGVQVKDVTDSSALLSWSQPMTEVSGITVTYAPTSDPSNQTSVDLTKMDTQHSVGDLQPDTEYRISLTSRRRGVTSDPVTRTFTTDLDSPRALKTLSQTDDSISLEWSNSVADVGGYRVKYTPFSGGSPREELVPAAGGGITRTTITGLRPGTEYGIGVTAVKEERESLPATTNAATDLDPPRDLEVVDSTETSLLLRWQRPRAKLSGYTLEYVSRDGRTREVKLPSTATSHALDDLTPDTLYSVSLTAERGPKTSQPVSLSASTASLTFYSAHSDVPELTPHGSGPDDNIISFAHLDTPPDPQLSGAGPADQLATLNVSGRTPEGFDLSWELRGPPVYDALVVEYRGGPPSSEVRELRLQGDSTGSQVRGLNASTEYRIALHGITESKRSLLLEAVAVTAPEPTSPGLTLNVSDDLATATATTATTTTTTIATATTTTTTTATIAATTAPTAPTTTAPTATTTTTATTTATTATTAPTAPTTTAPTAPTTTTATATAATATATTKTPQFAWDTTIAPSTVVPLTLGLTLSEGPQGPHAQAPGALEALTLRNVTSTSVQVGWSAPDRTFDHFEVEVTTARGRAPPRTTVVPGSERGAEIKGLSAATRYEVTLFGLADGVRSLPLTMSVDTEEINPWALTLAISDLTWSGFNVSWSLPPGLDFQGFVVELTNLDELAESRNVTLSGDASSLPMYMLAANTSYMVAVYGMLWDDVLEPVYAHATTVSQAVVGSLYVSNLTSEGFSISWNGTQGHVDGYALEIIDSERLAEPREYNISGDVTSYHVTGLRPSTYYVAYLSGLSKGSRTNAVSFAASTAAEPDLSRLVVSNITSDRFSLSWQTGEKAFHNFIVEVRQSAVPSQAMGRTLPGDARSAVMTGLRAATQYDVKMYASTGGQNSQPLFTVATTEDVPQLGPLTTESVSPDNLTLSWSTVSGHFDGFVIRVSDSLQQFDTLEVKVPSPGNNVTVSDLLDATHYDIELYGISHGRRGPSRFAHAITAPLPRVENLTVSNITPYGFRLSWETKQQQEGAPPGGAFKHFQVVVTDSGWLLKPHEFTVPGNQTSLDLWGLITGIGYEVRLTGVSRTGLLSRPLTTVAVTEAEAEVEQLFVSDVTADGFRLSWTAEAGLFDRFVIRMRDAKRLYQMHVADAHGDERTAVFTGLMSGTEYDIELYGMALGKSSESILGVVQTGLGSPSGLQFSDVTDRSVVVQWAEPRFKVDSYRVLYVPLQQGSPMSVTVDGAETQALLPGLAPGRTYQVTVMAVRGLEESDPSTDTVTTALDSPRALNVLNVTETSALLLWSPTAATVDGYVITYSADSRPPVTQHVSGNTVEFEMGSLVPATDYKVGVYATKNGQRSGSATVDFTTDVDAPRDLVASNVQTDGATLSWRPPRSALSGYKLRYSSGDGTVREVVLESTVSSYSPRELTGSTEYRVTLQAIAAGRHSPLLTTTFTTIGRLYPHPRDCAQVLLNGESSSGLHTIYLTGDRSQPIQVYCDMTTDQGGWLVFLRRQNGKLEFFRNWRNYTAGFGNMEDEFWLGLTNLHKITNSAHYELRVDLRDNGETAYAQYDNFTIAEPRTRYKIYVGNYSGTAGDSVIYHQGRPFSTFDHDNDAAITNCALSYKGAFWYKNCHRANLMGKYGDTSHSKGINWYHWKGHEHSIQFAEMKMRPVNFSNFESRRKRS